MSSPNFLRVIGCAKGNDKFVRLCEIAQQIDNCRWRAAAILPEVDDDCIGSAEKAGGRIYDLRGCTRQPVEALDV